jgi:hypothetical protein
MMRRIPDLHYVYVRYLLLLLWCLYCCWNDSVRKKILYYRCACWYVILLSFRNVYNVQRRSGKSRYLLLFFCLLISCPIPLLVYIAYVIWLFLPVETRFGCVWAIRSAWCGSSPWFVIWSDVGGHILDGDRKPCVSLRYIVANLDILSSVR